MDRKAIAKETLRILKQGFYQYGEKQIVINSLQQKSVKTSELIKPEQWETILKKVEGEDNWKEEQKEIKITLKNESAIKTILDMKNNGKDKIGVLNFASAKNPGGGFLNGAKAQEETLAASSGLYNTLIVHPEYYEKNRACDSMIYTDYAIYSPDVVFFRDEKFALLEQPVTASVITMPAVNMGQLLRKGEDKELAKKKMKDRMRKILALFKEKGNKNLVLGAYGCGVFLNNPKEIAGYWKELLEEKCFLYQWEEVVFAVMDYSQKQKCIQAFEEKFR